MYENTSPEDRLIALAQRRAQLERELQQANEGLGDLQEQALLLVPQHLLSQVKGGSVEDFKNVLRHMERENEAHLPEFGRKLAAIS